MGRGLLWKLEVPGNAAGLSLENNIGEWYYLPNNIDPPFQVVVLLAVMSRYLQEIEARIKE